ncbi:metal ABC transporter ATP-binding protein [Desulfolutivibrio sulfoxidireducens]|uniref:metal ABC transporter ATP-binding protein n=1 Tax=Desulfolutivibrio sulfoxidireducens TaxID=2773299 RepID=UPI00159D8229|nr:ATP-binding cassette domain-containing protein [Desulfolutivibrio sulfoxidireducens]QLA20615.1 ATP-binding cassette domain-containing protein [Desulfolutivibrio sulfoxidireducens]
MSEPVVAVRGVSFAYDGQEVLRRVDLDVARGDFLAVLGPNGGGKTTLLRLILGLLRPNEGTVRVFGQEPDKARGRVGYVPQQVAGGMLRRDFPITVREVVLMGLLGPGCPGARRGFLWSAADKRLAEAALEKVEMGRFAARRFPALSGGQQKRVLIARSLVSGPELLILDEPTANIDPQGKFCFHEVLSKLTREVTTIAVSHDLSLLTAGVTAVASVNVSLAYNPAPELTPEMIALIYGVHSHQCPMDAFIRGIPTMLEARRAAGGPPHA